MFYGRLALPFFLYNRVYAHFFFSTLDKAL